MQSKTEAGELNNSITN